MSKQAKQKSLADWQAFAARTATPSVARRKADARDKRAAQLRERRLK